MSQDMETGLRESRGGGVQLVPQHWELASVVAL